MIKKKHHIQLKLFLISFFIFILNISKITAQTDADIQPKITPPYPATADLGKFGNVPVGLFTGSPAVNLELYTLKEGGNTIPLTMSYSSSGVQVDAIPKQLGIDWNLIATGVVTRSVMDQPDDTTPFYNANPSLINCAPNETAQNIGGSNTVDTEKDVFNLNAFGLSAKFILADDQRNTIQIDQSKIKILYTGAVFNVTDVDGTVYTFGGLNATEESLSRNEGTSGPAPPVQYTTSWYLTKIQKPGGLPPVIFSYSQEWMRFYNSYFQKAVSTQQNIYSTGYLSSISEPRIQTYKNKQYHNASLLMEIKINNKKIIFDYDYKNPAAEFGSHNSKQLTSIKVYNDTINLGGSLIKKIDFDYYQVTPSTVGSNQFTNRDQKLIFLKEVAEQGTSPSSKFIKYSFDYYEPEKLPARHSFAKDIYGYFNGGNKGDGIIFNNIKSSQDFDECNPSALFATYKDIGSPRTPNPLYVYYGMLKSIYYPTKGKTVLEYEPNLVSANVLVGGSGSTTTSVSCQNAILGTSTTFQIVSRQIVNLNASVGMDDGEICEAYFTAPHHVTGQKIFVSLINATTNETVLSFDNTQERVITQEFCLDPGWYKITAKAMKCSYGYASIKYYEGQGPHWEIKDTPMGGVRVKRTRDYDPNQVANSKRYYYSTLQDLDKSSASFATKNPYLNVNIDISDVDINNVGQYTGDPTTRDFTRTYSLTSGAKMALTSFDGITLGYSSVIESWGGDNFENGGVENIFAIHEDIEPEIICEEIIRNTNFSNAALNGKQLKKRIFKKENSTIKNVSTEDYFYNTKTELDFKVSNFVGSPYYKATGYVLYLINQYLITSRFSYLSKKITSSYDIYGNNPITTTIFYNYNNNNHLQLTSQSSLNSNRENLETKFFYAPDAEMAGKPFINELKLANMVGIPLDTQTFKAETKIQEQLTTYDKSASTSNLLLPKFVYSNKGVAAIDLNSDKKITYDQYDDKGNLLQYTLENGIPVSIIWGYNKTQPIAKLENVLYSAIPSQTISNLQTLSNSDNDNCISEDCREQQLRNALKLFSNSISGAFISTYTYNPLVGVTSVTDVKGLTSYYEYDSDNRLKLVRDSQGNIVSENIYHYKNQD